LEFAEIRELSKLGRVEALKIYSSQPLRFFFFAFHTNQYNKPEFISKCRAILTHEKAIQLYGLPLLSPRKERKKKGRALLPLSLKFYLPEGEDDRGILNALWGHYNRFLCMGMWGFQA
jgi:hypothetical protein